jgi:hypothetical protein
VFRTVNDQPTLWDSILPPELLVLPVELGRVEPVIPKRMSHQRCVAILRPLLLRRAFETQRPGRSYAVGVGLGRLECGLFRDASTGDLPDAQGAEVFDHGVDGRFQRSGVSADLAEQQAALDGGQRRECQVVDLGAVG